MSSFAIKSLF